MWRHACAYVSVFSSKLSRTVTTFCSRRRLCILHYFWWWNKLLGFHYDQVLHFISIMHPSASCICLPHIDLHWWPFMKFKMLSMIINSSADARVIVHLHQQKCDGWWFSHETPWNLFLSPFSLFFDDFLSSLFSSSVWKPQCHYNLPSGRMDWFVIITFSLVMKPTQDWLKYPIPQHSSHDGCTCHPVIRGYTVFCVESYLSIWAKISHCSFIWASVHHSYTGLKLTEGFWQTEQSSPI